MIDTFKNLRQSDIGYLIIGTLMLSAACYMGYKLGEYDGYRQGKASALSTSPVSEELEVVCAGLWVGEQNVKYWKANK